MIKIEFKIDENNDKHMYLPNGEEICTNEHFLKVRDHYWKMDKDVVLIYENNTYLAIPCGDDTCGMCYFVDKSICPSHCNETNFIKLRDLGKSSIIIKSKICNSDLCMYHNDCDNAPICIYNIINNE